MTSFSSLSRSHINTTARVAKWLHLTFNKIHVRWSKEAGCETESSAQRVLKIEEVHCDVWSKSNTAQ